MRNNTAKGFTLIELIIVMVVIAILAAIAYPSYVESVNKAKRSEGKAAMSSIAQSLERCFTRHNAYDDDACPSGNNIATESGYYGIEIDPGTTDYELTARPNFTDEKCGNLTLNHLGQRGSQNNGDCW